MEAVENMIIERFLSITTEIYDAIPWSMEGRVWLDDVRFAPANIELQPLPHELYCVKNHIKTYYYLPKCWHIGRVLYFVKNPDKITPVSIETYAEGGGFANTPYIEDGHHRFMAARIRGDQTIPMDFGGWLSVKHYLVGKRKTKPRFM